MKYALVVEISPVLLQAAVQRYLDDGWELNGPPFNWRDQSGSYLVQSVCMTAGQILCFETAQPEQS